MSAELRFVDTNVLVYLFDADAPAEQAIARELISAGPLVLGSQILSEFYVTVTRKLARPLGADQASRAVTDLCALPVRAVQAAIRSPRPERRRRG